MALLFRMLCLLLTSFISWDIFDPWTSVRIVWAGPVGSTVLYSSHISWHDFHCKGDGNFVVYSVVGSVESLRPTFSLKNPSWVLLLLDICLDLV